VDFSKAARLQERLAGRIRLSWGSGKVRRVAGADVACSRGDDRMAAAVVVLSYPGLKILETASVRQRLRIPYVPGFLSFREGPPPLRALRRQRIGPDVTLLDGNGIAHPRRLGLASHVGVLLDIPTVGCAKSPFYPFQPPDKKREPGRTTGTG